MPQLYSKLVEAGCEEYLVLFRKDGLAEHETRW